MVIIFSFNVKTINIICHVYLKFFLGMIHTIDINLISPFKVLLTTL